uniref:Uncharacterized protein n=1 Tax=Oryza barthii TaxID=65489 RepID=A0A0D3GQW1_9ORYZ
MVGTPPATQAPRGARRAHDSVAAVGAGVIGGNGGGVKSGQSQTMGRDVSKDKCRPLLKKYYR